MWKLQLKYFSYKRDLRGAFSSTFICISKFTYLYERNLKMKPLIELHCNKIVQMFISTDNQRLNFWVYLCWLYVAIWECLSKSISLGFQGIRAGISGRQQSFKGGEGLKKNCLREYLKYGRFLPVFRGKIKVGDQSSPAEKKGRLLKTDTLIRRERVIRTLQSLITGG